MTTTQAVARVSFRQWIVIFLLFLAACLNYIDRGSLSVGAPEIAKELALSPVDLGLLFSAFFWTYTGFMVVAGWLADRYPVRWVFAIGFLLWSAATFASGFATSMWALLVLRLVLGAGETVTFPVFSKIIAAGFPPERRALPNSLLDAGTKLGPAIGTLAGALLMAHYGWRIMFFALGAGSLLWLIPWLIFAPRPAQAGPAARGPSPSLLAIIRRRDAWGTFIGSFCYAYGFYFLLTWLPTYLVNERNLSLQMMGVLGSIPFWSSAVAAVAAGWASDTWIRHGGSPTLVRKTFVICGLLLSMAMLPAALVSSVGWSIAFLTVAYVAFGIYASNLWAISQTLAGADAAGKWTGIQNTINSLAGVIAPIVTGYIVQNTGSYYWAFLSPAIMAMVGAASYVALVGPIEPIDWSAARTLSGRTGDAPPSQ